MKECMKTDKKVQILLSTYNGEQYLEEQLESYTRMQGFDKVKVLIRDDGSTDRTRNIIQDYCHKFDFECIEGSNIGVNASYFELFDHCDLTCEYFALSDQDDVWFTDKIEKALAELEKTDSGVPVMFASSSCVTDVHLEPIGTSELPVRGVSFYNAMIQNICPGHTQVLNRAMLLELRSNKSPDIFVLDYWNYIVASAIGEVVYLPASSVYHRQHSNNAVGYPTNAWKKWYGRLKRLTIKKPDLGTRQLWAFYSLYKDRLKAEYRSELEGYLFDQKNIFKRIHYVCKCHAYRQTRLETFVFKSLYVLGKYHL